MPRAPGDTTERIFGHHKVRILRRTKVGCAGTDAASSTPALDNSAPPYRGGGRWLRPRCLGGELFSGPT